MGLGRGRGEGGCVGRGQSWWRGAGARLSSGARRWGQPAFRRLPSRAERNRKKSPTLQLGWDALGQGTRHKLRAGAWQSWEKLSPPPGWLLRPHYLTFPPPQLDMTQVPGVALRRCEHHEPGKQPKLGKVKRGIFPPSSTGLSINSSFTLWLSLRVPKKMR